MIGYIIEQELGNELPFEKHLATLLTMIEVDAGDPAFKDPTKPIGPLYTADEAKQLAAGHIDALATRLIAIGAHRLALVGGLAAHMEPWVSPPTRAHLVPAVGDALDGALQLARSAAEAIAA